MLSWLPDCGAALLLLRTIGLKRCHLQVLSRVIAQFILQLGMSCAVGCWLLLVITEAPEAELVADNTQVLLVLVLPLLHDDGRSGEGRLGFFLGGVFGPLVAGLGLLVLSASVDSLSKSSELG
mmetsp:Transcript_20945/g.32442  ORF Transcript_20945/g.32442 Transcript_20945/m.32442 type:complete len:123 (+) Transcript_20945:105-473(+)